MIRNVSELFEYLRSRDIVTRIKILFSIIFSIIFIGILFNVEQQLLFYSFFALTVLASLFFPGYALLGFRNIFSTEERVALSFAVTIPLVSFTILIWTFLSVPSWLLAIFNVMIVILSLAYILKNKNYRRLIKVDRFGIEATILLFSMSCFFVAMASPFFSGAFNILVQRLIHTGAADNYIPYRIAQFVVNHLDPQNTNFLSSWTIADRTPLMGLTAAFFMQVFHMEVPSNFLWALPSTAQGNSYHFFQIIGSLLNSLIILGSYILIKDLFNRKIAVITTILLVINSFVFLHVIFTWPKNLTAYFVLISYYLLRHNKGVFSGFTMALAFLSHPFGAMYVVGGFIYSLYKKIGRKFILSASIVVLPWFLWSALTAGTGVISRFVYFPISTSGIPPSNQPNYVLEQFLETPLAVSIWNRITTAYAMLAPFPLTRPVTSEAEIITKVLGSSTNFTLAGALGLSIFVFCYYGFIRNFILYKRELTCFIVVPFLMGLIVTGWARGLAAMHILQPLVPIMLALGVATLYKKKIFSYFIVPLYLFQHLLIVWLWSYSYTNLKELWTSYPLFLVLIFTYYATFSIWAIKNLISNESRNHSV